MQQPPQPKKNQKPVIPSYRFTDRAAKWNAELQADEDWRTSAVRISGLGTPVLKLLPLAFELFKEHIVSLCQTDEIHHKNEFARRFINRWRCADLGTDPVLSKAKKRGAGSTFGDNNGGGNGNGNAAFYSRAQSHINPVWKVKDSIDLTQRVVITSSKRRDYVSTNRLSACHAVYGLSVCSVNCYIGNRSVNCSAG